MKIRIILEADVKTKDGASLLAEKAAMAAKDAAQDARGNVTFAGWTLRRDRKTSATEEPNDA